MNFVVEILLSHHADEKIIGISVPFYVDLIGEKIRIISSFLSLILWFIVNVKPNLNYILMKL